MIPTQAEYDAAKQRQADNVEGAFTARNPTEATLADVRTINAYEAAQDRERVEAELAEREA